MDPFFCEQRVKFVGFVKVDSLLRDRLDLVHEADGVVRDGEAGVPLLLPLQSSSYVTTISDSAPVCPPQLRQTIFVRRLLAAAVI